RSGSTWPSTATARTAATESVRARSHHGDTEISERAERRDEERENAKKTRKDLATDTHRWTQMKADIPLSVSIRVYLWIPFLRVFALSRFRVLKQSCSTVLATLDTMAEEIVTYCSAGGVVIDGDQVLLVRKRRLPEVRLPKGHVEPGEGRKQAALRETAEET